MINGIDIALLSELLRRSAATVARPRALIRASHVPSRLPQPYGDLALETALFSGLEGSPVRHGVVAATP